MAVSCTFCLRFVRVEGCAAGEATVSVAHGPSLLPPLRWVSLGFCRGALVSLFLCLATPCDVDVSIKLPKRHGPVDVLRRRLQQGIFLAHACVSRRAVSVDDGAIPESRGVASKRCIAKLFICQLTAASLPSFCDDAAAKVVPPKPPRATLRKADVAQQ